MAEFDRKLLTFWIFVPTLDMISDMNMVIRLFRGPEPDLVLSGGKCGLIAMRLVFLKQKGNLSTPPVRFLNLRDQ